LHGAAYVGCCAGGRIGERSFACVLGRNLGSAETFLCGVPGYSFGRDTSSIASACDQTADTADKAHYPADLHQILVARHGANNGQCRADFGNGSENESRGYGFAAGQCNYSGECDDSSPLAGAPSGLYL
jgi:hypothetical protein